MFRGGSKEVRRICRWELAVRWAAVIVSRSQDMNGVKIREGPRYINAVDIGGYEMFGKLQRQKH